MTTMMMATTTQNSHELPPGALAIPEAVLPENSVIPDRMFFRIGDVAEIVGIQPYVLRFWEKEFEFLAPIKNSSGQRLYRKTDVESVLLIKRLLYVERYSIEGAKMRIKELRKTGKLAESKRERGALDDSKIQCLREVRSGLEEILRLCR